MPEMTPSRGSHGSPAKRRADFDHPVPAREIAGPPASIRGHVPLGCKPCKTLGQLLAEITKRHDKRNTKESPINTNLKNALNTLYGVRHGRPRGRLSFRRII